MEGLANLTIASDAAARVVEPSTRTTRPIVTGTSVLALKYADGVMFSADTLASYGGLARFKDARRLHKVGEATIMGADGEYSDMQWILKDLNEMLVDEQCLEDGRNVQPSEVHSYLTRVMYEKRNKMKPLWNNIIVGGVTDGKPFLGTTDRLGTAYTEDFLATGFGMHMAIPILREHWRADLSEAEARGLLEQCMRVLFYRDARTINRIQLAKATADGLLISEPYSLTARWDYAAFINPSDDPNGVSIAAAQ